MSNSRTSNQDFTIEIYKNFLKSYIIERQLPSEQLQTEIEKYITVFSLYLQNTNDSYKYNLPYLSHQNKRFSSFLVIASRKSQKLRYIVAYIKKSKVINTIIQNNSKNIEEKNIEISLNDFLTADLSGNIDFHKLFSLSGAERTNENDIITIMYKQQVRSVNISKIVEMELNRIVEIVVMLLNNSLTAGGE